MKNSTVLCHVILRDHRRTEEMITRLTQQFTISEIDRMVVYADAVSVAGILQSLEFFPVASEKRLVIVRNIEAIARNDWPKLLDYLSHPYEHVCLILTGESASVPLTRFTSGPSPGAGQTPEAELFSAVYSGRRLNLSEALNLFHKCLEKKEESFPLLLSAVEIHLRKRTFRERKDLRFLRQSLLRLHQLDLALKTGRLTPEAGLEL
ncbi:MAG TPA: hypothetical protein PK644_11010, partial [bacterium]|nr:hypothetical protein [bacterium]